MRIITVLAFLACLLSSPHTLYAAMTQTMTTASPAIIPPLTGKRSVEAALVNHRAIAVAQETFIGSKYDLRQEQAAYGPQIFYSASAQSLSENTEVIRQANTGSQPKDILSTAANLNQLLWDGYATRSLVRTADAESKFAEYSFIDEIANIAFTTLSTHAQVLLYTTITKLSVDNVLRHEEILNLVEDRTNIGMDTIANLSKTNSRLANAKTTLINAQATLQNNQNTLMRLTGLQDITNITDIAPVKIVYTSVQEAMTAALTENPTLVTLQANINLSTAQQQLAQSAFAPQIALDANLQFDLRQNFGETTGHASTRDISAQARWNVFNTGGDVANVLSREALVRRDQQTMEDFLDSLLLEIEIAMKSLEGLHEQYTQWTAAVKHTTRTRDIYQEQFLLGQRDLLDLLNSDDELYTAKVQQATINASILRHTYLIPFLTGAFLSSLDIPIEAIFITPVTP